MLALEEDLDDQTSLVPKELNKRKLQNQTDYLKNVKKEKKVCESSDIRNFVGFAKKSSTLKIKNLEEKALMTILKKGTFN